MHNGLNDLPRSNFIILILLWFLYCCRCCRCYCCATAVALSRSFFTIHGVCVALVMRYVETSIDDDDNDDGDQNRNKIQRKNASIFFNGVSFFRSVLIISIVKCRTRCIWTYHTHRMQSARSNSLYFMRLLFISNCEVAEEQEKIVTYLQYDSPFGFDTQTPSFLHGDGAHDVNPKMTQTKTEFN